MTRKESEALRSLARRVGVNARSSGVESTGVFQVAFEFEPPLLRWFVSVEAALVSLAAYANDVCSKGKVSEL